MQPSVREWLAGKDILITGGSGFMGKVLIEKLLRTCPGVKQIYLLIRAKRGEDPQKRWSEIADNPLFGILKQEHPEALRKVTVINSDLLVKGLGISKNDKKILIDNISVVFHTAASVRFDDPLAYAVNLNTRGTYELLELAKLMKKLECFEYVSTTYCNCNLKVDSFKEEVYTPVHDWKVMTELAERETVAFNTLLDKILRGHPNTYTLTKSLAENVVKEASQTLPCVILRPSVVTGCYKEPIPGWLDNFNGAVGVTTGVCKGVLRAFRGNPDAYLDYVPVDAAVNGMIVAAWHKALEKKKEIAVYNAAYADYATCTFNEMVQWGVDVNHDLPMDNNIWYPFLIITNNTYYYHTLFYLLQFIPALLLDTILMALGHKTILMKLNIKIYLAGAALVHFTVRSYRFDTTHFKRLWDVVPKEEEDIFFLKPDNEKSPRDCLFMYQKGAKKFLLNEKESDLERFRAKHWRLYYIDRGTKIFFGALISWYLGSFLKNFYDNYISVL